MRIRSVSYTHLDVYKRQELKRGDEQFAIAEAKLKRAIARLRACLLYTSGRNGTAQYGGRVQMGEGGGRSRVGQVVRRHINGLNGGDGALVRGGNALLQRAHFGGQGGLITYSGEMCIRDRNLVFNL